MSTIAPAQLVELVAALRTRHPGIALQVADGGAQALQERLLGGELDVAIYALPDLASDERLNHLPLYREPFVAVVADTHRLARRETVRMAEFAGEPYLWRLHCEHTEAIDAAFARHGVDGPTAFQSDRDEWILAMAAAGLGYALMPARSVPYPGVAGLRLIEPDIVREIALVTPRGRPDAPSVGALVHEVMRMRWTGTPTPAIDRPDPVPPLKLGARSAAIARLYRDDANSAFPQSIVPLFPVHRPFRPGTGNAQRRIKCLSSNPRSSPAACRLRSSRELSRRATSRGTSRSAPPMSS